MSLAARGSTRKHFADGKYPTPRCEPRFNQWIAHGAFAAAYEHALHAYDRIIGLDLTETAVNGSLHTAPLGGDGTGPNPTDRGRSGWKWSTGTDRHGTPVGWAPDGANRNDIPMFEPTLQALSGRGLHHDIETMHLDRGYDCQRVRDVLAEFNIDNAVIARRPKPGEPAVVNDGIGRRWPFERTNSWLSNSGQLRRNTERPNPP